MGQVIEAGAGSVSTTRSIDDALLRAIRASTAVVLLIGEVDKADVAVEGPVPHAPGIGLSPGRRDIGSRQSQAWNARTQPPGDRARVALSRRTMR